MTTLPSGLPVDDFSDEIRPQDDLFLHVHSRWLERTEIPSDKARWGSFAVLAEEAEAAVREIVIEMQDAEPGTDARKVGDLYASFLDEQAVDAKGIEPIRPLLERAEAVSSVDELLSLLGELESIGGPGFTGVWVDTDPGDPTRYLVHMNQGGLGMPDESYYREEAFAEVREAYLAHLTTMFGHLGAAQPDADAAAVFALETELASHHWDRVASRDDEKTYNLQRPLEHYEPLRPWLRAIHAPDGTFDEAVVRQPSFFEGLGSMLVDERLPEWRAWLRVGILRSFASYLTTDISKDQFDFYGRTLTGAPEQRERWKRGISLVEGMLGDAIGKIYVERHYPPEAKAAMDVLIEHLVVAYRESIEGLEWMGAETRRRAIEKLEKFTPKIGYPAKWRDYSALEIGDDLVANVQAATRFEHDRELAKIGKPIDRDEWFMNPQTVNAYYNPGFNEIVFPAAILQPPFFDAGRDAAANYGAIGAVIGHEIGHGFDDQGSKYDGDGRLIDWWTDDDRKAFELRTGSLIAQYDGLEPAAAPGHKVNGALTIGENIGDLGGLGIAWRAYLHSLGGEEPPVIDGLTGAQRFFLSWAHAWQIKIRPEEAVRLVSIDPHSPNEHRTNQVVKNLDAFVEAFGVQPGDGLWLDPEARVTIW
ncbi:M13-type metalloendopeptidase [Agrococcus sp. Marseille-Q4369]|uniref:M13 family metallopeptidase n=1 Tax=Agrococcus sp. Marseille-Q4369 TaxID=2810513 RepID=UPI001B8B3BE5|nr:M13-type metalloendopeptidase [Agrococcus sp. Marseille-Q4369]QUW18056.1 peptidase M13 [Agrococcus sp. Marseille-Q4369]